MFFYNSVVLPFTYVKITLFKTNGSLYFWKLMQCAQSIDI